MSVLRLLTNSDAVILNDSEESHLYWKHEILRASSQNDNVKSYVVINI